MLGLTAVSTATLLKEHYPKLCKRIAELEATLVITRSRAEAAEAERDRLSGYTTHGVSCHIRGSGPGECTCGLDDALRGEEQ